MKTLLRVLQLLPGIIEAVRLIEALVPIPQTGKQKLEAVLGIITDTTSDVGDLIPAIVKIVARIVGLANTTGVFKTGK